MGTSLKVFTFPDSTVSSNDRIEVEVSYVTVRSATSYSFLNRSQMLESWDLRSVLSVEDAGKFMDTALYGKDKIICLERSQITKKVKLKGNTFTLTNAATH